MAFVNILYLESSSRGNNSRSRQLANELVEGMKAAHDSVSVTFRDLNNPVIPHVTNDFAEATNYAVMARRPLTAAEIAATHLSDQLVAELRAADLVILAMPMYNWSIPSVTKAYIDQIVRPGVTVGYGPQGVYGLLPPGKKLYVISTRGGTGYDGPRSHVNFADPYIRMVFGFLGFEQIEIIAVENNIAGGKTLEASMQKARERMAVLTGRSTATATIT
jgi:FMN-dependent NADH-azoreductase